MAARFSRQMKASALLCAALFPLTFLYDEILLRLFAGEGLFPFLQYPFLTALAAGLLAAVLTSFGKKSLQRVLKTAVLLLASLWFIIQTLLNRVYAMYFPFSSIGGEAGDVASEYTDMLFRTILLGIPIIVLYLLPPALYILSLLRRKRRTVPDTVSLSGHAKKREIAVLLGLFVILQSASVLSESHGSQADLYGMGYTFDNATRVFGLLTSTRLDLRYLLFGMDESGSFDLDTDRKSVV